MLKTHKITHILIVAKHIYPSFPESFKYKAIPADDAAYFDLSKYFHDSIDFIDKGRSHGNVLVHCAAGISRSSAIVVCYVMCKKGIPYSNAYEYVRKKHIIACPNSGFVTQLKNYEKEITKKRSQTSHSPKKYYYPI